MLFFYLISFFILLPAGVYFYFFFRRFWSLFPFGRAKKGNRILAAISAACCMLAGSPVYGLGAVLLFSFLAFCLLTDLFSWMVRKHENKRLSSGKVSAADFKKKQKKGRILYCSGLIPLLLVALSMSYGYVNMHQIRQTAYSLTTEKELSAPLTIVQISDLHMGTTMTIDDLESYCRQISDLHPDIVALTGDITDENTSEGLMQQTASALGSISATYGIYYVFGNHDYNSYVSSPLYTPDDLRDALQRNHIAVLEDTVLSVTPQLTIIGRKDASQQRQTIQSLMQNCDPDSLILLLDHQPRGLADNASAGVDLQLSGHTHAGQIWPTGQLASLSGLVECNYGWKQIGSYQIIVSSGIGGWGYPIRTGGHSEYVVIKLQAL